MEHEQLIEEHAYFEPEEEYLEDASLIDEDEQVKMATYVEALEKENEQIRGVDTNDDKDSLIIKDGAAADANAEQEEEEEEEAMLEPEELEQLLEIDEQQPADDKHLDHISLSSDEYLEETETTNLSEDFDQPPPPPPTPPALPVQPPPRPPMVLSPRPSGFKGSLVSATEPSPPPKPPPPPSPGGDEEDAIL